MVCLARFISLTLRVYFLRVLVLVSWIDSATILYLVCCDVEAAAVDILFMFFTRKIFAMQFLSIFLMIASDALIALNIFSLSLSPCCVIHLPLCICVLGNAVRTFRFYLLSIYLSILSPVLFFVGDRLSLLALCRRFYFI